MRAAVEPADMLLFAAVVEAGGFSAAAKHLGSTRQSLSERVAALELALGVRLLERTTRSVRATAAGMAYFQSCVAIGRQVAEANDAVREGQQEPVGHVRMTVPVAYGRGLLMPVIAAYLARFPRVTMDVHLSNQQLDLVEDGYDLALRVAKLEDSSLTARKLGDATAVFVASSDYLETHGYPLPTRLAKAHCVALRDHEIWQFAGRRQRIRPVLQVNDVEAALHAAIAGVGVAEVPAFLCRDAVDAGRLQVLFDGEPSRRLPVSIVYPSRRHLPLRVALLIEMLTDHFRKAVPWPAGIRVR